MQTVSITGTSLKPLHAHKTVISTHNTEALGKELTEWSHMKQKAKKAPQQTPG